MPLPSLAPPPPRPPDSDDPSAPRPVVGAAELTRLAGLFAARGILRVQGPLPTAPVPVCPQCGATDGWFTLLLTAERVCQCRLMPAAGSDAG
jgi:hypothetical protein